MGVDGFSITLDKPSRQYSPGENMTGKVFLRISGEETTTEITIRFFGSAHTHWMERESRQVADYGIGHSGIGKSSVGQRTKTVYENVPYDATDVMFDFAVRLFGDGNTRFRIPVGDNIFPFAFQVPVRPLPVTCSFEDGHITYGLEGRIRKPWYQFDPKSQILPVIIFTIVDLNLSPGAGSPMQAIDSKEFGCCCCPSQPCVFNSFTPKLGFCPGDVIPFVVEIHNQSNQPIFNVTATLTQMWVLHAYGRRGTRTHYHPLALQAAGRAGVNPGEKTRWDISFTVPMTVAPSSAPNACSIFKLEYKIDVSAATEGCCGNANFGLSHPILIGTIPLRVPVVVVGPQTPSYNEKGGSA